MPRAGINSITELEADTWYHVALTYNHSTTRAEIYVNGILESFGNVATEDPGSFLMTLGNRTGANSYFNGMLDDVRIYDNVLSTSQIREFMNNRRLVAHWNFNGDLDNGDFYSFAFDSGPNFNTGQLSNAERVDGGISFNGSSSKVDIPARTFDGIKHEISLAFLVKGADTQPRADTIFNAVDSNGQRVLNIHLPWRNSTVYWDAGREGSVHDRTSVYTEPNTYKGNYNHWVFTKNAYEGRMSIYVNGKLLHTELGKTGSMINIATAIIGSDVNGRGYAGEIDDVKVYSHELSAEDVDNLFNFEVVRPVAFYRFEELVGNFVAVDSSGNDFNAAFENISLNNGDYGFNGVNSTVKVPAEVFSTIEDKITISMWVNGADDQPRNDTVFNAVDSNGNRILNIHLPWSKSRIFWDAGFSNGGIDRIQKEADAAAFKGGWNNWVFTKNSTTGLMEIYLNGKIFHSATGFTKPMQGITNAAIGSAADGKLSYSGLMRDIMIFPTDLSAGEIEALYLSF